MTDFDDFVQALREEHDGSSERAATRARIMVSLHEGRHRRRVRWSFGIPVGVILLGSTAWAAARGDLGESAQAAVTRVSAWLGVELETPSAPPSASQAARAAAPPPVDEAQTESDARHDDEPEALSDASEPAAESQEDAAPSTPAEDETPSAVAAAPTANPSTAPRALAEAQRLTQSSAPNAASGAAPEPLPDPTLVPYRRAHEAQFRRGDCAEAVAAYDEYLRAAPQGALVPEARFHRAVCLVRLGRRDEARAALEPFARGDYGTYRQEDAQALLTRLAP